MDFLCLVPMVTDICHKNRCYTSMQTGCQSFQLRQQRDGLAEASPQSAGPAEPGGGLVTKLCPTLATPQTAAHQAPLSMGFSRQQYWSAWPFPPPGDLPHAGTEPRSPTLQVVFCIAGRFFLLTEPPEKSGRCQRISGQGGHQETCATTADIRPKHVSRYYSAWSEESEQIGDMESQGSHSWRCWDHRKARYNQPFLT